MSYCIFSVKSDVEAIVEDRAYQLARKQESCTATSSGYLVTAQFKTLVYSGSKAEMDFGEVSFSLRVYCVFRRDFRLFQSKVTHEEIHRQR